MVPVKMMTVPTRVQLTKTIIDEEIIRTARPAKKKLTMLECNQFEDLVLPAAPSSSGIGWSTHKGAVLDAEATTDTVEAQDAEQHLLLFVWAVWLFRHALKSQLVRFVNSKPRSEYVSM
jgi:DNA polymerase III epsilon subunit-like protein